MKKILILTLVTGLFAADAYARVRVEQRKTPYPARENTDGIRALEELGIKTDRNVFFDLKVEGSGRLADTVSFIRENDGAPHTRMAQSILEVGKGALEKISTYESSVKADPAVEVAKEAISGFVIGIGNLVAATKNGNAFLAEAQLEVARSKAKLLEEMPDMTSAREDIVAAANRVAEGLVEARFENKEEADAFERMTTAEKARELRRCQL